MEHPVQALKPLPEHALGAVAVLFEFDPGLFFVSVLNFSPCDAPVERLGCRRLGDLLGFGFGFGYDFGLCFALGGDSGGGQIGGLLGGGIVR